MADDLHLGPDAGEDRRSDEGAVLSAHAAPVDGDRGALAGGLLDCALDPLSSLVGDHRSDADFRIESVADPECPRGIGQRPDQSLGRRGDRHHHRSGHAALARGPEGARDDPLDRAFDDRVRHHHHVVLRAPERLHPLAVRCRRSVDVRRDRCRADERDGVDPRGLEDRLRDLGITVDQVDDARRQLESIDQLEHPVLGQRHLL